MPMYKYQCSNCRTTFEEYKYLGKVKSIKNHVTYEETYEIDGKNVTKKEYKKHCDTTDGIKCPACFSKKIDRIIEEVGWCFSDNIRPGSGFAEVDRRHQEGIYSRTEVRASKELSKEMKEAAYKDALKDYEKDKQILETTMKPVTEQEAISILHDTNRKQEVTVLAPPKV